MNLKKTSKWALMALSLGLVGCDVDPYNQGNYVNVADIKGKEGIWSKKDVENAIGTPSFSDPQNTMIVYYVGVQGVKYPVISPTIHKSATLQLEYDVQGKLKKITVVE